MEGDKVKFEAKRFIQETLPAHIFYAYSRLPILGNEKLKK
jgi:hypothetical protein